MPDIEDMTPGQVLAEASVADFIKSLGLSIAEAQKALDENSVNQMGEFITPRDGMGGKSLLDIGLMPAFYHYQHADIACSMQLSLRVEKNIGVGVNIGGSFSDTSTENDSSTSSSSSSESGSTSSTSERSAELAVQSASVGQFSIGGQNFTLTGADPLERMRALQDAVTSNPQAGVGRLLYEESDQSFTITTTAPADKVTVTNRTVAFRGGGFDRAVIQVDTDAATAYRFNGSTTVNTTAQGSVAAYADHVAAQVNAAGIPAGVNAPTDAIIDMHFETGRHDIRTFTAEGEVQNEDYVRSLQDAGDFIRQHNLQVELEGFADAQPYRNAAGAATTNTDQSNRALGDRRANELRTHLIANGAPAGNITVVPSRGAADAQAAGGPADQVAHRRADVRIPGGTVYYIFCDAPNGTEIEGVDPDKTTPPAGSGNGFVFVFRPQPLALGSHSVTIDGTTYSFRGSAAGGHAAGAPEAYAVNLRDDINGDGSVDFTSSARANIVTIYGKQAPFRLQFYTAETRNLEISGSESITVTRQFSRSQSRSGTEANTGNRTVAIGASVDVRYGRQFEMNVSGNSSISARLVSIPAPPQFLETIKDFLDQGNEE